MYGYYFLHSNSNKSITYFQINRLLIFNENNWNESLNDKNWSDIDEGGDVNGMALIFTTNVSKALDEIAPFKKITIKSSYKFGLSQETKDQGSISRTFFAERRS